jgi:hypothetical protein
LNSWIGLYCMYPLITTTIIITTLHLLLHLIL